MIGKLNGNTRVGELKRKLNELNQMLDRIDNSPATINPGETEQYRNLIKEFRDAGFDLIEHEDYDNQGEWTGRRWAIVPRRG